MRQIITCFEMSTESSKHIPNIAAHEKLRPMLMLHSEYIQIV